MERAREVEAQLTDEERFSLLISVMGTNATLTEKDPRIPDGVPMSAGYTPGIPARRPASRSSAPSSSHAACAK